MSRRPDPIAQALAVAEEYARIHDQKITAEEREFIRKWARREMARSRTEANKGRIRGYFHRLTRAGVALSLAGRRGTLTANDLRLLADELDTRRTALDAKRR